jgi:gamma-glutamyl:cysteine ligase YbdK (ATP-grasp superfamily)
MTGLGWFEGIGVEVELMIVDGGSLDVAPLCDRLIESVHGSPASEVERGRIAWSNELVLHVLELKTNGPAPSVEGLAPLLHAEALEACRRLEPMGATLMPTGTHPWMDPLTETKLWPHEYNEVYRTFDRIFGCSGHGWSNLQSTHINLPFRTDQEFGRLHSATRSVLPLIPALAASSPFMDAAAQGVLDARLRAYAGNARRVPEVTGLVVPDPARSEAEYRERILDPLYAALAPLDPSGVLRHEWANARGAIARFERGAVEIRLIDAQECPASDVAVVALVSALVRAVGEDRWASLDEADRIATTELATLLERTIELGGDAEVENTAILKIFGWHGTAATAMELWRHVAERLAPDLPAQDEWAPALETVLARGPLAERLLRAHAEGASLADLARRLINCLRSNVPLHA